ncbi:MAG: thioredoxin domain-containing protein, partial [Hydrogenoanaerobacterium sp.]
MSVKEITDQNFVSLVSTGKALVDFWAPWCNPCKMLGPIIEQVASEAPEGILIG